MSQRIAFITLGCKANHFDTLALMDLLREEFTVFEGEGEAEFYVVNTCSVTHRADAEARKIIRRLKRLNPKARLVVTGCYAQTAPEELSRIAGLDYVIGNSHKERVSDLVRSVAKGDTNTFPRVLVTPLKPASKVTFPELPLLRNYSEGTRAFLKIQEGCDYACTFCLTTIARGNLRSYPLPRILEQLQRFEEQGYKEVVLTGIQIGQYGRDLSPPLSLAKALRQILTECSIPRIRLTSIDPREVDEELIALVASEPRICPHLHIPAQSGSTTILKRMGRGYSGEWIEKLYKTIRQAIPHCLLGSDIIVGFPGEGSAEFDATLKLISHWLDHVHAFPYSDRPGTKAAHFPHKVPPQTIERRMDIVRTLSQKKRQDFARKLAGTVERVLVETTQLNGRYFGYTDHYVPVYVEGAHPGELRYFHLELEGDLLVGRPISHLQSV